MTTTAQSERLAQTITDIFGIKPSINSNIVEEFSFHVKTTRCTKEQLCKLIMLDGFSSIRYGWVKIIITFKEENDDTDKERV